MVNSQVSLFLRWCKTLQLCYSKNSHPWHLSRDLLLLLDSLLEASPRQILLPHHFAGLYCMYPSVHLFSQGGPRRLWQEVGKWIARCIPTCWKIIKNEMKRRNLTDTNFTGWRLLSVATLQNHVSEARSKWMT